MHSFNFIKIFSFDISNRYFYCFAYWLLLSSFLVIVFVTHTVMFSAVESFLLIFSSEFSCFCHRLCSRTRKPRKVLISNFFRGLKILSYFEHFSKYSVCLGHNSHKAMLEGVNENLPLKLESSLLFLEAKLLLRYQIGGVFAVP